MENKQKSKGKKKELKMKFTKIRNQLLMRKIGAISMAVSIGCASFGVLCHAGSQPKVAAESKCFEELTTVATDSLVGIESNIDNMIEDDMLTTSVTTTSTATSSSTTTTTVTTTTTTEETTDVATTTTEVATTEAREYVVYKPSTHYIHRSTCRWFDSTCYEITNTEGLECVRCSECNPEMEIMDEFVVTQPSPVETTTTTVETTTVAVTETPVTETTSNDGYYSLNFITDEERIYLCNTVGSEYGSDWISLYDKACVVACVMNRVNDGGWSNGLPSTVYNVLTAPYQFNPAYAVPYYRSNVTQSCIDAVEYYFQHQSEFPHYTSFCGNGQVNIFR